MLINADCTIFVNGGTPTNVNITGSVFLSSIYWNDSRGMTVTRNGAQIEDAVLVYLYDTEYIPKAGDIIVKGNQTFTFDGTSAATMSASFKAFRAAYPDFAVIKNVVDARYGGLPHIELMAR